MIDRTATGTVSVVVGRRVAGPPVSAGTALGESGSAGSTAADGELATQRDCQSGVARVDPVVPSAVAGDDLVLRYGPGAARPAAH
ncbi:hypothetical protein [Pseudonocardia lacus]|uniref:hypothetical protein n=1 Tax=Pseudonocardia lacus TaxID=2835865 RepID=UPI001BDD1AC2|nr:hypothetical protein [Pseudonocardia lacus]